MATDTNNPVFDLAVRFVNQTARSVFLTGKAGTGKTTFLKHIRENSFKKMAVVAPTGVAAINAGGTTLHSFFQLPFGPFLPSRQHEWNAENPGYSDPNSLFRNIRFNAAKRELLKELELLVIDEISMVRADTLDAVDTVLRHFREQPLLPFGGLQVLYIGDLFQLPPVITREEEPLLQAFYPSPFFFDSQVIRQAPPVCLELKKIYRQNDARFIDLLNNIRNNRVSHQDLMTLSDYYQPDFTPPKNDHYITLTSHNAKAESINQEELGKLRGRVHSFVASVTGEFNDKAFPAEKTLALKEGAQVMLIKNDKGETRRYYNGKIGTIQKLTADKITLAFPDEPDVLVLEKETWRNIRYNYDKEKDKVNEEELGTFSQYPIRLAWAITIHKSQGLTFERAVIDAGASFAPGQVYVALSRLTSLEGLVLRSRISPSSISTDHRVVTFTENSIPDGIVEQQLEQEQLAFISESLLRAFQWERLTATAKDHYTGYAHRAVSGRIAALELSKKWLDSALAQQETAQKFTRQLEQLLSEAEADGYCQLQQRTAAAASYFIRLLEEELISPLQQHIGVTRIKKSAKTYLQELQTLKMVFVRKRQQIEDSLQLVNGLQKGITTIRLLSGLEESRRSRELADLSADPETSDDTGATPRTTSGTASRTSQATGRPPKGETRRISLDMFKEGIPITEIAARRELAATTVESHLASFIPTGEIDIKELVPEHKMEPILSAIRELAGSSPGGAGSSPGSGGSSLSPIKSKLGNDYSFGEIRAVLSYFRHTSTHSSNS